MGLVRHLDQTRRDLEIVASIGMPDEFLKRFGRVPIYDVACGLAMHDGEPVMIEDVDADETAVTYRQPALIGGYKAKYSTLMVSRSGELIGTIATCFRKPHRPSDREIRLVELFARQAADFIENARLKQALKEAERRKDAAVAALAHEIRNPLHVIITATHGLKLGLDDGSRNAELCDVITRQARLMSRLADELIDASRVGTGATPLQPEIVDLNQAMASAIESVTPIVRDRRHRISIDRPSEAIIAAADPLRLEQILVNLLINAAHYTDPGGTITLDAWQEGAFSAVRVRDTGVGIAPEMLPLIFEPFVRAVPHSHSAVGGLGLGLALVKIFVERQGGNVTASSDGPGRGSEFIVRLPRPEDANGT
jgi:signal transduction histidine kinase